MKENGEEIEPVDENENANIGFDDILGTSKSKYIDQYISSIHQNAA